ncbi:MAG: SDR family oxidoreductase [Acidimicrobiales bacterium]
MDLGIDGRAALVTAASKGLGFASARALAADGAKVAITGRDRAALEGAAARIGDELGAEVLAIAGDITDPTEPARAVAQTVERFGSLDILVANAGGPPPSRALEIDDAQINAAVNANLTTSVRLVQAALTHLVASGQGRICLITSVSVVEPIPTLALSNLSRVGLWGWAKTAAADIAERRVTLNLACPGTHATDRMKELGFTGRMGDPADFGNVVAFLCSAQAGFINGSRVVVDGGASQGL